jgi:Plavaka transposase
MVACGNLFIMHVLISTLINICRIWLRKTPRHMGPCLYPSSLVVIKPQFRLPPDTQNIGQYTCPLETSTIMFDVHTRMASSFLVFWPYPRVSHFISYIETHTDSDPVSAEKKYKNDVSYRKFRQQLLHTSLVKMLAPLKPGMTTPEVARCPDGHFRKVIYDLGPYIADYPEQALLACIVQGWCLK